MTVGKTVPELDALSAPVVGTDVLTFYRSPGPLKRTTASVLNTYITSTLGPLATLTPGTGVATALAINVGSAGAFVTFNGALGTPSSGTLTNVTGLPIAGISGLGTGVGTALAINVGSAGAFTTFNGAGGTPSSMTLTNATGLPIAGLVSSTSTALGVGSLELGDASDTTLARSSAGNVTIEGNLVYRAGGTDVPITDGGTGSSTAADARTALAVVGLTDLAASTGAGLVGSIASGTGAVARTVQAKLRDTVNVLDFGAVGDGVTDDTTAITNALATGKDILFPEGLTFLTAGNHSVATNNQKLIIKGTVKKKSGTVQSVFVISDQTQGVLFTGGGTIDGNRTAFTGGQTVSGILAFRAIDLTVDGIMFQNLIDDGIKAHNCPNLVVTKSTRFYNIYNMGVEMRSYGNDPRTGLPWVGVVYGPSGDIDGFYDLIDDGLHGAGNGVGVDFSPGDATAPDIVSIRVSGRYRDCLRAIFAENNVPSTVNVQDIVIDSPVILGNFRGVGTCETKDGIGVINCKNVQIIAPIIRNVGNFVPPGGVCAGIQISGNDVANIDIINPQIMDDTGAANRTDYGIYIGAGSSDDVRIRGGCISGMSDAPIEKGGAVNLRIEAVDGAADDQSWGNIVKYTFKKSDLPATANTDMLWEGEAGQDAAILGPSGRIVMVVARLSGGISSGSLGFKTYRSAVEETALEIVNADWGGGLTVVKKQASRAATQVVAGAQIKVTAISNSLSPTTIDAIVEVYVDVGMKA